MKIASTGPSQNRTRCRAHRYSQCRRRERRDGEHRRERARSGRWSRSAFLVQEFVDGVELIVGARDDAQFGPVVIAGLGGTAAEVLHDVAIRLLPVTHDDALAMLGVAARQRAARRVPRTAARATSMRSLSAITGLGQTFLARRAWLAEIEINPLIAGAAGQGARAVDLRFTVRASARRCRNRELRARSRPRRPADPRATLRRRRAVTAGTRNGTPGNAPAGIARTFPRPHERTRLMDARHPERIRRPGHGSCWHGRSSSPRSGGRSPCRGGTSRFSDRWSDRYSISSTRPKKSAISTRCCAASASAASRRPSRARDPTRPA